MTTVNNNNAVVLSICSCRMIYFVSENWIRVSLPKKYCTYMKKDNLLRKRKTLLQKRNFWMLWISNLFWQECFVQVPTSCFGWNLNNWLFRVYLYTSYLSQISASLHGRTDSNQSAHLHSLICQGLRDLAFLLKDWTLGYPKSLIRLCGCAGWSESSLGAHANFHLLLNTSPFEFENSQLCATVSICKHGPKAPEYFLLSETQEHQNTYNIFIWRGLLTTGCH